MIERKYIVLIRGDVVSLTAFEIQALSAGPVPIVALRRRIQRELERLRRLGGAGIAIERLTGPLHAWGNNGGVRVRDATPVLPMPVVAQALPVTADDEGPPLDEETLDRLARERQRLKD